MHNASGSADQPVGGDQPGEKATGQMQAIIINYNDFQRFETLESLLQYYFPLLGLATGLAAAGVGVTIFQRYRENRLLSREGVPIHLVTDYGPDTTPYQIPLPLHRQVAALCRGNLRQGESTVVHLNGLLYPLQTWLLRRQLPRACPLVVQHHGSRPWAQGARRAIQRWGLQGSDGFLFTTAILAEAWIDAGVIRDASLVHEVMETSAILSYEARASARAKSGLSGHPVIFWAGNLDENKDPLTILRGFALLLPVYPEAHLYMAYRQTPLLDQVQRYLAEDRALGDAVTLLGTIPHEQMADYFNSADLFVQGSSKEGSGIALLECLACGVIPVVTDIPAFRTITGNEQVGALWPVGDEGALAAKLKEVLQGSLAGKSQAARSFFEENWSFTAIGQRMRSIYELVAARRGGKAA